MAPPRATPGLAGRLARGHRDEHGQSLVVVLALITLLFLAGTAMATHVSVALRTTVAGERQAADLHAADAGVELGIWWQRAGRAGDPPPITVNGRPVTTTVVAAGGAPCDTATPIRLTGFEHGRVSASGGGLFTTVTGTGVAADSAVARSGAYSLRIVDAGSRHNAVLPAAGATVVARLYLRLEPLPAADVAELVVLDATAGNDLRLGYQAATGRLTLRFGALAATAATIPVTAGTFHRLDLRLAAGTNPRTADWQVDGVDQPSITAAGTASAVSRLRLGSAVIADQYTAHYDDVLVSATAADYPLGDGAILALRPDGPGAHATPASFRHEDGSAIDATTHLRLDDDPMTSTADFVRQQTAGAASYVELAFGDTSATCIVGVAGILAYHSASSATNNGRATVVDGATERTIYSGDLSETALFHRSAIVPRATWTTAAVNALRGRVGYSTDVSPLPYFDGLLLEVATGGAGPATVTVTATAGASTVVATYADAGAAPPVLQGWTASR